MFECKSPTYIQQVKYQVEMVVSSQRTSMPEYH